MYMLPQWIIEKKRDNKALSEEEIRGFIKGYSEGTIPDYQMSAMAMAIYLNGMTFEETTFLTDAMMKSGSILDHTALTYPTADKHSTGGIGDKVSLILAPLAACCGIAVPMLSGRGLGITGGTLDKLESIPGYRTDLSIEEFSGVLKECGCSIIGQTAELAPADKKLYALRDVTATVPSIPLISASIMSKKLAENTDALVLDVKWGKGAFMKTREQARELAETMIEIGSRMDKAMTALLTDMNQPLGSSAGNALEVAETIEALKGEGTEDLMAVTIELSAHMLLLCKAADGLDEAKRMLTDKINSGAALDKFRQMVELQGGDLSVIDDPSKLPAASDVNPFTAKSSGYITEVNADLLGRACLVLGAGRQRVDQDIDPAVGLSQIVKAGTSIQTDETLAIIHSNSSERENEAKELLEKAFVITPDRIEPPELIVETITNRK